jgi:predicted Zn-dependent peptidase
VIRVDRAAPPVPGVSAAFRFPAIHRRRLSNGLDLRVVVHRGVPVVSAVLLVRGGTASDPAGREGLAAFTADLLDEGSGGRSALQVADEMARYGADLEVDVGPDATLLSLSTLSRYARQSLTLLAEMAIMPNLADADIERVRKLRLERLRQLRDHAPAIAERALVRVLYGAHPYGHLSLGSEESLSATTIADIRGFHRDTFVPAETVLVITGDAEEDDLVAMADMAFGAWDVADSSRVDTHAGGQEPPAIPSQRLTLVPRPDAAQSELRLAHVCASRTTPDYHALVVLNTILGGQFVSRVNLNLRQDKGYTYGARTGFDLRRGRGPFALQTSVQSDKTVPAIRESLRELADIRGPRPATAEELALAKASVTLGYPRGFETAQQVARGAAHLALHELPDTYFEEFVPRVEAVTGTEVTRVAADYLDLARMATVIVGDPERIGPELETLGDAVIVSADML